jgi:hypothetical protein
MYEQKRMILLFRQSISASVVWMSMSVQDKAYLQSAGVNAFEHFFCLRFFDKSRVNHDGISGFFATCDVAVGAEVSNREGLDDHRNRVWEKASALKKRYLSFYDFAHALTKLCALVSTWRLLLNPGDLRMRRRGNAAWWMEKLKHKMRTSLRGKF